MRCVLLVLMAAMGAGSADLVVKSCPKDQLTISVPADWVEIPKEELERMTAKARDAFPKARPQPYDYGFQAPGATGYPRAIVQVKRTGRWSDDVIAKMPEIETQKGKIEGRVRSGSAAPLDLEVGKVQWDAAKRIAWMRIDFAGADGGRVHGLTGVHPTAFGSVQVNCYAPEADFEALSDTFAAILSSVRLDEAVQYRERVGGIVSGPVVIGTIAASVAVWAVGRRRRRRAD